MKLLGIEWASGSVRAGKAAGSHAEVDRLLGVMRAAMRSEGTLPAGMETRVLAALRAHAAQRSSARGRRSIERVWAPIAVTALLLCLFTGGFLVARNTATVAEVQQSRQSAMAVQARRASTSMRPVPIAGASTEGLTTASARLKPATPIPAGRRRGRAGTTGASTSR